MRIENDNGATIIQRILWQSTTYNAAARVVSSTLQYHESVQ